MALPFSADRMLVCNGSALVAVDTATPSFIQMTEILVSGVPSGNYSADLPTTLESQVDAGNLWISIYDTGITPSVSDPLYGYVSPANETALINAVTAAIAQLEVNIDPCELKRALAGAVIQPTKTVFGPCQKTPTTRCP
jgi:hypothetical protein